jgi:uncharacterized protein (DUF2384 family)
VTKTAASKNRGQKAAPRGTPTSSFKVGGISNKKQRTAKSFSARKSIEELAAEQGTAPTRLEDIWGKGADLWGSDEDLERFVEDIYARRREDRELSKP